MLGNCTKLMLSVLLAALWTIRPALADTTTCVSSPGGLTLALASAETASGTSYIELVQGTYDVSSTLLTNTVVTYHSLQLLGGYTDTSCSTRVINPENTVIDGANGSYARFSMNSGASLVVEGLRFQNFSGGSGAGVQIGNRAATEVRFNHFYKTGLTISDAATPLNLIVSVDNNLVDESEPGQDGLHIAANNGDSVSLTGNTIGYAANRSLYLCVSSDITTLANNIIWGSGSGTDIRIGCDIGGSFLATFDDNTYGTLDGAEDGSSTGTLHSDPLFVGAGNYRLKTAPTLSPSINSGDNNPSSGNTGTDLDGNPRIVGSAVDRGAYESSYDDTTGNQIVVTNTNDSGPGSLRDAITQANAVNVFHYIDFNIPGSCPQNPMIITLNSVLPSPKYGMRINGFSQPGTSVNTSTIGDNAKRCIVLDGGGTIGGGLSPFFGTPNQQFWVQGLVFEGFHDTSGNCGGTAVGVVFAETGALIWGNQFGGKLGNMQLTTNDINISAGTKTNIGGSSPAQRNIIDGASCAKSGARAGYGIFAGYSQFFGGSSGVSIVNNLIGTDAAETTAGYNDTNVHIESSGNTIKGNVIANAVNGIELFGANATGNTIDHNLIGITESYCQPVFPYLCLGGINAKNTTGILFTGAASGNTIYNNTIWYNSPGVEMVGAGQQRNILSGNSTYSNTNGPNFYDIYGGYSFGYSVGVDTNNADPNVQARPNRGLNTPFNAGGIGGPTSGTLTGRLDSTNHIYNIEVFSSLTCDGSYGQGQIFHGSGPATISNALSGQNGFTVFHIPFNVEPGGNLAGRYITLTATDDQGNTSQFSQCRLYTCDVIFRHGFDSATAEKCP